MNNGRYMPKVLMRRDAHWSKPHFVQLELHVRLIGNYQVPDVRWIEGAAKDADFHRLLTHVTHSYVKRLVN